MRIHQGESRYNYSSQHPHSGSTVILFLFSFLNCVLSTGYMIYLRTRGRHCIALVHSALKEDLSQWFWCKKIWFVSIRYWLAELASSPVVTSDKWPYLLCYYVQHNHARNSQRNIEPTLHWLGGFYLFQELKDASCRCRRAAQKGE